MLRSYQKLKHNNLGNKKHANPKTTEQGFPLVTDVQLMYETGYEGPTYDKSGTTKVKNDQVNYHYCWKISGKKNPNVTGNF